MNCKKLYRVCDMANLLPKRTGLPYTIWYGPKESRHRPRVKVSIGNGKELSIEIESHKVLGGVNKIDKSELTKIFEWLDLNIATDGIEFLVKGEIAKNGGAKYSLIDSAKSLGNSGKSN